jgi:ABC-type sugar transport system ATPase subunit
MAATVTGISKTFAGIRVLRDVSVAFANGNIHALLGSNGSGKSTLVKVLTGVYQPERGSIEVGSSKVDSISSPHEADRLGIAVVHQESPLIDAISVGESIALFRGYPTSAGRIVWPRLYRDTREMLERYDVGIDPRRLGATLTPAERALVALSVALDKVGDGLQLLILDEVTASLPEAQADLFLERVTRIAEAGTAVLLVTHRLQELEGRVRQATVLRDGSVVYDGDVGSISRGDLVALMIGQQAKSEPQAVSASTGAVRRLWAANRNTAASARQIEGDDHCEVVLEVTALCAGTLRDVSFTLKRGEIVGLAGAMDSGIGELPKILGGSLSRLSGDITVLGRSLPLRATPRQAIKAGISVLPVDRLRSGGIGSLPLEDNIILPAFEDYWHAAGRRRAVLSRAIDELDIRPRNSSIAFSKLSGGNQQKALLGKWLLLHPAVLVLEDPTSGVDPNARQRLFDVIRDAAAEGIAILFFSTEPEQLANMCSRVLVLQEGRVVTELSGKDLDHETISERCYS